MHCSSSYVFQNVKSYFGKHAQGFSLRPGRFFVKVFCIIHLFFLHYYCIFNKRNWLNECIIWIVIYPFTSNVKSPNRIGPINAFLIYHASYEGVSVGPSITTSFYRVGWSSYWPSSGNQNFTWSWNLKLQVKRISTARHLRMQWETSPWTRRWRQHKSGITSDSLTWSSKTWTKPGRPSK